MNIVRLYTNKRFSMFTNCINMDRKNLLQGFYILYNNRVSKDLIPEFNTKKYNIRL